MNLDDAENKSGPGKASAKKLGSVPAPADDAGRSPRHDRRLCRCDRLPAASRVRRPDDRQHHPGRFPWPRPACIADGLLCAVMISFLIGVAISGSLVRLGYAQAIALSLAAVALAICAFVARRVGAPCSWRSPWARRTPPPRISAQPPSIPCSSPAICRGCSRRCWAGCRAGLQPRGEGRGIVAGFAILAFVWVEIFRRRAHRRSRACRALVSAADPGGAAAVRAAAAACVRLGRALQSPTFGDGSESVGSQHSPRKRA